MKNFLGTGCCCFLPMNRVVKKICFNIYFKNYSRKNPDASFALHAMMEIPDQYKTIKNLGYLEENLGLGLLDGSIPSIHGTLNNGASGSIKSVDRQKLSSKDE